MTKIFSTLTVLLSLALSGQVAFSVKGNLIFPTSSASWKSISQSAITAYENSGKNNVGFNIGLSAKIDLPSAFFIMPELYYTTFKNEITDPITNTSVEAKSNRADLPILVGYKVWGDTVGVFAGPVASYNLSSENQFNDFMENVENNFTVGYQLGAQVKIKNLLVSARYEGAFSDDERNFINSNTNQTIRYDNRNSLFMAGLGYQF